MLRLPAFISPTAARQCLLGEVPENLARRERRQTRKLCLWLPLTAKRCQIRYAKARDCAGFWKCFCYRMPGGARLESLPLNGCWRFARYIVGHARYARDFIDDAVGYFFQQLIRQVRPTCGHKVDGFHGAKRDNPLVTTCITHNPN